MGCWNDSLVVYMIPTGRAVSIPGDWIPPHSTAGDQYRIGHVGLHPFTGTSQDVTAKP